MKDPGERRGAMGTAAVYLHESAVRKPMRFTPELSRRARGVEVWAAPRSLGRSGLARLIDRSCRHAQRFADGLSSAAFEIQNEVVLNQVGVSFGDDAMTTAVMMAIREAGTCWSSGTRWRDRSVMRIRMRSWLTTEEGVERGLPAIIRRARQIRDRGG